VEIFCLKKNPTKIWGANPLLTPSQKKLKKPSLNSYKTHKKLSKTPQKTLKKPSKAVKNSQKTLKIYKKPT
jgi:hypothetical protein